MTLYPGLRRFAAVVAPPEVAPDDLVHDALVAYLRRGSAGDVSDAGAYLRRMMLNLVSNHRRRLGRARRALGRLASGAPESASDHYPSDLSHLAALRPDARPVLYMQHIEGLPTAAIAAELGLSEAAVRKISSRARRALREYLDQEDLR